MADKSCYDWEVKAARFSLYSKHELKQPTGCSNIECQNLAFECPLLGLFVNENGHLLSLICPLKVLSFMWSLYSRRM